MVDGAYVGKDLEVSDMRFCWVSGGTTRKMTLMLIVGRPLELCRGEFGLAETTAATDDRKTVAGPALLKLEEIAQTANFMPHEQNLDRICEQIVDVPVPQMAKQFIGVGPPSTSLLCQFLRFWKRSLRW